MPARVRPALAYLRQHLAPYTRTHAKGTRASVRVRRVERTTPGLRRVVHAGRAPRLPTRGRAGPDARRRPAAGRQPGVLPPASDVAVRGPGLADVVVQYGGRVRWRVLHDRRFLAGEPALHLVRRRAATVPGQPVHRVWSSRHPPLGDRVRTRAGADRHRGSIDIGASAMPTLMKMTRVMEATKTEWSQQGELPVRGVRPPPAPGWRASPIPNPRPATEQHGPADVGPRSGRSRSR